MIPKRIGMIISNSRECRRMFSETFKDKRGPTNHSLYNIGMFEEPGYYFTFDL